jgi:Na+-driven multidrug efflux pump
LDLALPWNNFPGISISHAFSSPDSRKSSPTEGKPRWRAGPADRAHSNFTRLSMLRIDDGTEEASGLVCGNPLLGQSDTPSRLSPEETRFASETPLRTLLMQSIGPLIYFVGNATHDAVDLLLISRALGQECLQIVGFSSLVRYLLRSFAVFFSQGGIARVTGLIGEHRKEEAEQLLVDLFRLMLIVMVLAPILFVFIAKPMLVFMGSTPELADRSFHYLIPIMCAAPFTGIYQLGCGCLLSEGRSILNGLMQLFAFVTNCGLFAPLLLFVAHVDLNLIGLAFASSQIIPGITLFILIFKGKFNLKPTWAMWKKKFSKETPIALKLAAPFVLNVIAGALPPLLLMNFMMDAAARLDISQPVASSFSVFLKIQVFTWAFSIGINQGLLSSGSYAWGAQRFQRLLTLFLLAFGISVGIELVLTPIMITRPEWIAAIWITQDDEMVYAKKMLPIPFYANWLNAFNDATTNLLLTMKYAYTAMAPSLTRGAVYMIGAAILRATNKDDPVRMMWSFCINDFVVTALDIVLLIFPLRRLFAERREEANAGDQRVSFSEPLQKSNEANLRIIG